MNRCLVCCRSPRWCWLSCPGKRCSCHCIAVRRALAYLTVAALVVVAAIALLTR